MGGREGGTIKNSNFASKKERVSFEKIGDDPKINYEYTTEPHFNKFWTEAKSS